MKKRRKKRKHVYTRRPLRLIQCCDEQEKDVGMQATENELTSTF